MSDLGDAPQSVSSSGDVPPRSNDWSQALFEAIDDAVFVHDLEGNILDANTAALRRLGYDRDELLRLKTSDIDDPEFAAGFPDRLSSQLQNHQFRFEGRHRTKDGRSIAVDINTSATTLNGKPVILAVMRDITDRKQAEESLARQSHLLLAILNHLPEAVLVTDVEQHLLAVNPAARRIFGPAVSSDRLGQTLDLRGMFHSPTTGVLLDSELPLVRCVHEEEIQEQEYLVQHPSRPRSLWISVTARPLRDEQGNVQGGILVARDITERKRVLQRQSAQYAVAQALAAGQSLEDAVHQILQVLCDALGAEHANLWLYHPREQMLRSLDSWQRPDLRAPEFLAMTRRISFPPGFGLPGQVLVKNAPLVIDNDKAPRGQFPRANIAAREGLLCAMGFPIQSGGETIGVLEFFCRTMDRSADGSDDGLRSMMKALGSQIGQVLERHRIEKALRDSEAVYQSLVESLPQNIFRKDREGRVTFANQRYCNTLKISLSDLLGKTDFELFPKELAAKYVRDDQDVLHHGKIFEAVEQHHLPDGSTIFVQVVKTPIYDARGKIVGSQGIFWDVTERVRAEEKIANSERRYRQLTEATLDGIVVVNAAEKILLFNPAAEKMFGFRAEEIQGQPITTLIPTEYHPGHAEGFRRFLGSREAQVIGKSRELMGRRKDGGTFPVELALSVIHTGGPGDPLHFLGAFRDLTERNKMRSVLVQNEKLASIGLLSAGVAHEINNPLAFVGNNLVVLDRDVQGVMKLMEMYEQLEPLLPGEKLAPIKEIAEEIDLTYIRDNLPRLLHRTREGVDRVTRIVHSLRGLARTDVPKRQDASLPDLIDNSLEILRARLKKSNIAIAQKHEPSSRVSCVVTQMSQVLVNLLVNAVQSIEAAKRPEGRIRIESHRRGDDMVLEVEDNGTGIAPEVMPRLFDPFFTTKDVGEGTGLGLSISHNIITAHAGRIEVESTLGEGALFRIVLPVRNPRELS